MTRCLITGCGGFIGSRLAAYLRDMDVEVYGLARRSVPELLRMGVVVIEGDVTDRDVVVGAVSRSRAHCIVHLAAQSNIPAAWSDPQETFRVNISGTLHLLEAVRSGAGEATPLVVVAGSSAEYGFTHPHELPIHEDRETRPSNPYAVSKVAQTSLAGAYWFAYRLPTIRVRPFHVTGPGKPDACAQFAKGLIAVEREQQEVLAVGNLEAVRDIVDVRDAVRALWILATRGAPGEIYNLCSGSGRTMREVVEAMASLCGVQMSVRVDPSRLRPGDDVCLVGDNTKLKALGWRPEVSFQQTLRDIVDYWREQPVNEQ